MSLARSLRRSSWLVRLRRAWTAGVCALPIAVWSPAAWGVPVLAAAWPVDRVRLARALDVANQQEGRLVAAFELARAPVRTPFMEAAIRDAEARPLPQGLPRWKLGWVELLLVVELALLLWPRAPREEQRSVPAHEGVANEPGTADARIQALASLNELEAHVLEREAKRQQALAALLPLMKGATDTVTPSGLRSLADAVAAAKLSSAQREQLHEALERARESEKARLADAQSAQPREQERKLDQLTRPPERTPPSVSEAMDRAAESMQRKQDPAPALRDGAEALAREQREAQQQHDAIAQQREELQRPQGNPEQREQFEQAARGGGSEPDPGEHAPAERRIGGSYQDSRLRGIHGEGPSRSQVIEGASQAGFANAAYRRVYADYRAHAEQLLERDDVPPGERFYVRRYFDLVQPR